MGAFHPAMKLMVVIGKHFADAGLASLMVELGVLASGSISMESITTGESGSMKFQWRHYSNCDG